MYYENGFNEPTSDPKKGCLHFTSHYNAHGKGMYLPLLPLALGKIEKQTRLCSLCRATCLEEGKNLIQNLSHVFQENLWHIGALSFISSSTKKSGWFDTDIFITINKPPV